MQIVKKKLRNIFINQWKEKLNTDFNAMGNKLKSGHLRTFLKFEEYFKSCSRL